MDLESFAKEQLLKYLAKVPFNTLKKKKKNSTWHSSSIALFKIDYFDNGKIVH